MLFLAFSTVFSPHKSILVVKNFTYLLLSNVGAQLVNLQKNSQCFCILYPRELEDVLDSTTLKLVIGWYIDLRSLIKSSFRYSLGYDAINYTRMLD